MTRRRFVGTMGAAAAAAALQSGQQSAKASETYYFQDSFGDTYPFDQSLIDLGFYPPAPPSSGGLSPAGGGLTPGVGGNYHSNGYPKYNILMIIVDQMRNPGFWLPSGSNNWMTAYANVMPNITGLAKRYSILFPNYFVAATACTPSRACLLTGLYSQQTCMFETETETNYPSLLPYNSSWTTAGEPGGFPTIGNVLSPPLDGQNGYNCTWIGKWHLSCASGSADGTIGENGPSDYGFASAFNIPTANNRNPYPQGKITPGNGYPSPNGGINEGAGGDLLDSYTQASPDHNIPNFHWPATPEPVQYMGGDLPLQSNNTQLNDAAIAYAFTNYWLPFASGSLNLGTGGGDGHLLTPWFCAVSFINPHDVADFPYAAGLITPGNTQFTYGVGNSVSPVGFQPAPQNLSGNNTYPGSHNGTDPASDTVLIRQYNNAYTSLPAGAGSTGPWNFESSLTSKPRMQTAFQLFTKATGGVIQSPGYNSVTHTYSTPQAWEKFLNYYLWLQSCVDYQVGQVLGTNPTSGGTTPGGLAQSPFNNSTLVIFTSDHGDFGGSHGLHSKAGALYDESLNVPLIVSYPELRNANNSANNGYPLFSPSALSSVDLLPYLYSQALGNEQWRNNSNDMIYYLAGRESIFDAVLFQGNSYANFPYPGVQHRRVSGISLNNSTSGTKDWQKYQPFVLHTTDEFPIAKVAGSQVPSHAIGFRTIDQTELITGAAAPFYGQNTYGGGKLGVYSFWDTQDAAVAGAPITGIPANSSVAVQYEFYNFSPSRNSGNANPQEVGNETDYTGATVSSLAAYYMTDFNNTSNNSGISIQSELYNLNNNGSTSNTVMQVRGAIQTAFNNYISYLECQNSMTGANGQLLSTYGTCLGYNNNV